MVDLVQTWLENLSASNRRPARDRWNHFLEWLNGQPGWDSATPESVIQFQEEATGRRRFVLDDLIKRHVRERGGTRKGMLSRYSAIRSFFLHSHVELPKTPWNPEGTKEPTRGKLTLEGVRRIIEGGGLRDRAVLLTLFQGMMDLMRFTEFNGKYAEKLVNHLKTYGAEKPLRIDFMKGRKNNHIAFYTFIGRDALEAWKEYFEKERGWTKPGEPIAVVRNTMKPLSEQSTRAMFNTLCVRYKLKTKNPGKGDRGHRTGINPHEIRDVVRSYLQTAKKDGLDETCVEFWMGHQVDPLNYNKFAELNPKYVEENYRIAERYLNILSSTPDSEKITEQEDKMVELEEAINKLQLQIGDEQGVAEKEKEELYEVIRQLDSRVSELLGKKPLTQYDSSQAVMRAGGWPVMNKVARRYLEKKAGQEH